MYKPTVPEFRLFHCVAAPSQDEGGRTIFVDTTRLLANVDLHQPIVPALNALAAIATEVAAITA